MYLIHTSFFRVVFGFTETKIAGSTPAGNGILYELHQSGYEMSIEKAIFSTSMIFNSSCCCRLTPQTCRYSFVA
jgi:hypothetical protein